MHIYRHRSVGRYNTPRGCRRRDWPKTPRPHARAVIHRSAHAYARTHARTMVLLRLSCSRRPHHPTNGKAARTNQARRDLHATRARVMCVWLLRSLQSTARSRTPLAPACNASWAPLLSAPATDAPLPSWCWSMRVCARACSCAAARRPGDKTRSNEGSSIVVVRVAWLQRHACRHACQLANGRAPNTYVRRGRGSEPSLFGL